MLNVKGLLNGWFLNYNNDSFEAEFRIFEAFRQHFRKPLVILRLLIIKLDLTWQVYLADHIVSHQCAIFSDFPRSINNETILDLIGAVSSAKICQGTFEERYITMARI